MSTPGCESANAAHLTNNATFRVDNTIAIRGAPTDQTFHFFFHRYYVRLFIFSVESDGYTEGSLEFI